ncbi:MAG: hypothetical protein QW331_00260 [Candidatus Woesearchaeota archaeon]
MTEEKIKPRKKWDHKIIFRVSKEQYELFQNKKEAAGYATLSQFIRDRVLKDSLATEVMIAEIHRKLLK